MIKQTLERIRGVASREHEYDSLERERLKTDQVTEASERLNGAMENVFQYAYHDGDFYFQGEALRPIFIRGIQNTEEIVKSKPQFGVELIRRHLELRQLDEQVELIKKVDWQNPLVLVHISPTPDAVLDDGVDLNAYDTERKKIMVRITEPTLDGVKVTSLSLDGGDRVALQAVGDFFGVEITSDASSEDILGMHFLAEKSQFDGERPAKVLRERYDKAMKFQYGGEWYAGRQDSNVTSTIDQILAYPKLVDDHVNEVWGLKKRFGKNFRFTKEYEDSTYNFLAAIEQSHSSGKAVMSLSGAGSTARASGVEYSKSDCPTSQVESAEQALEAQGIGKERIREEKWMSCPDCGLKDACYGDPCASRLDCRFCKAYVENGVMHAGIGREAVLAKLYGTNQKIEDSSKPRETNPRVSVEDIVKHRMGSTAVIRTEIETGGAAHNIVNSSTGEILQARIDMKQWQRLLVVNA